METDTGAGAHEAFLSAEPCKCASRRAAGSAGNKGREFLAVNGAANFQAGNDTAAVALENDKHVVESADFLIELIAVASLKRSFHGYDGWLGAFRRNRRDGGGLRD